LLAPGIKSHRPGSQGSGADWRWHRYAGSRWRRFTLTGSQPGRGLRHPQAELLTPRDCAGSCGHQASTLPLVPMRVGPGGAPPRAARSPDGTAWIEGRWAMDHAVIRLT